MDFFSYQVFRIGRIGSVLDTAHFNLNELHFRCSHVAGGYHWMTKLMRPKENALIVVNAACKKTTAVVRCD